MGPHKSKANCTSGVAGNVEVVAAPTDRTGILIDSVQLFVTSLGIKVVQNYLPDAATHVGNAKAVAASCSEMIHR